MMLLGLDRGEVATAVRHVRLSGVPDVDVASLFARSAWGGIAEPGDSMAGLLVRTLGPVTALGAVIDGWSPQRLADAVAASDESIGEREHLPGLLQQALQRWGPRVVSASAIGSVKTAAQRGAVLLLPGDGEWPEGVNDLGLHAPLALWMLGTAKAARSLSSSIALVGARAATGYGEHVAMEAAAGLVEAGFTIVSGAAYGIDGMAHRSALASDGITAAFLAGGVDRFYPSGHDALLSRIAACGAVLSELPCGSTPTKWRFLQRNRLIAAASQATVVLEAGWRSGSLNTAGHAAALGRSLGAVPGPVTSVASSGCHRLIREFGASCVTSAAEMAELVPGRATPHQPVDTAAGSADPRPSPEVTRVLDALTAQSRSIEHIARLSGLSVGTVQSVLGGLGLEGEVVETEGGWRRAPRR